MTQYVKYINEINIQLEEPTQLNVALQPSILTNKDIKQIKEVYKELPYNNKYNLFLLDPPWTYALNKDNKIQKLKPKYRQLSMDQLKLLPIKQMSKNDAILLMWTTSPMIKNALELIKHYGYSYTTVLIYWIKTKNGKIAQLPSKFNTAAVEVLLLSTKGNINKFLKDDILKQVQFADVLKHSEKPKNFQKLFQDKFKLNKMDCIELFARGRTLPNFDLFGDELTPPYQKRLQQQLNLIQLTQDQTNSRIQQLKELINDNKQWLKIKETFQQYLTIFAFEKQEISKTNILQHNIELQPEAIPIAKKPYKLSQKEYDFLHQEVQTLLKLGCIRESKSEWAQPVVIVPKHNNELRLCIDYRLLNKLTKRDNYPLPRIDDILQMVAKGKIFTRLDLKSGFWQVQLTKNAQHLTAFITPFGVYEWIVMPFGLTNAPATFQRLMDKVLSPLLRKFVLVYIDDIIIYSETFEQHIKHIKQVFELLHKANLHLGITKCEFFKQSIQLLGHTIEPGRYKPLRSRTEAILNITPPKNVKEVQAFLGIVNYYRIYIKNIHKLQSPLQQLTKSGIKFVWENQHQQSFDQLKQELIKETFLYIPQEGIQMILQTDFSEYGIGAILCQNINNQEKVIEYASRTLKRHENNYPAYKGEILAVTWAMQKFRYYLLRDTFTVMVDNQAVQQLLLNCKIAETMNGLQKVILRWIMNIQEFHFIPIHRSGKKHLNADALSRLANNQNNYIQLYQLIYHDMDPDIKCVICKQKNQESKMLICECCGTTYHTFCHQPKITIIVQEAWYCTQCMYAIEQIDKNKLDITLDFNVINYLKTSTLPLQEEERQRIINRSQNYSYKNYKIYYLIDNITKLVPTIVERIPLLYEKHEFSGHGSKETMLSQLNEYFWDGMSKDILNLIARCDDCARMRPRFREPSTLKPSIKGDAPWQNLSIDLTGDMNDTEKTQTNIITLRKSQRIKKKINKTSQTQNKIRGRPPNNQIQKFRKPIKIIKTFKNRYLIICVDDFSKMVEIQPIPNRESKTIANWFLNEIIKRYGCPKIVRTDRGTEFGDSFNNLLQDLEIQHLKIAPRNPQANGLAERTVRTVKETIKRFINCSIQELKWDEACHLTQLTINSTKHEATGFQPFQVLYGRQLQLPQSVIIHVPIYPTREATKQEITQYVTELINLHKTLHQTVRQNLTSKDEKYKLQYSNKKKYPTPHEYTQGQEVYVKLFRTRKNQPKVRGPYYFIKYTNNKRNIVLTNPRKNNKTLIEATRNCTPGRIIDSDSEEEQNQDQD